jgi:radical SAM superfamily enzyme YgiQ (UPF0313 family)
MKALLLEPSAFSRFSRDEQSLVNRLERQNRTIPLGVTQLGAVLRQAGHDVQVWDLNVDDRPPAAVVAAVAELAPDLVGVSNNFTLNAPVVDDLLRSLRAACPEATLVAGGVHASFLPGEALRAGADCVALFEAEETLVDLARSIDRRSPLEEVPGLVLWRNERETPTFPRPRNADLDRLPLPIVEDLPVARYQGGVLEPAYNIISTRGCDHACYYCASPGFTHGIRARSVAHLMAEVDKAKALGFDRLGFADDNLAYDRDRFLALCAALARQGVRWGFNARCEQMDEEMLQAAMGAGCIGLRIGVETGSPAVAAKIRRKGSLPQVLELVRWCRRVGLRIVCGFMFPHHCDTLETVAETWRFIKTVMADGANVNVTLTTPYPGTALYNHPDRFGITITSRRWEEYDLRTPTFTTPVFDLEATRRLYGVFEDMFLESAVDMTMQLLRANGIDAEQFAGVDFVSLVKNIARL